MQLERLRNAKLIPIITAFEESGFDFSLKTSVVDGKEYLILPGLCDVHVHLREPGFLYKESIKTGTAAAAHGGYTTVLSMPNLNPVPDSFDNLKIQLDAIAKDAVVEVLPYASITKGEKGLELADMDDIKDYVCAFSDDGRGVQSDEMMLKAMKKAKELDKMIVAHCEVNSLLNGGYIHDGEYARLNGHRGICSKSEYEQIKRDVELAKKTGVKYHVCHISTKESVDIIRQAKKDGVEITCETAPHYLILTDMDLKDEGRFKMNPPLRGKEDRDALIEGLLDGTIDMIATDHAPHSKEEKSKGLMGSMFGIVGLETAFSLMYTYFVKTGIMTIAKLMDVMAYNPRRRFGIKRAISDFAVFEVGEQFSIDEKHFLSQGKSTPFAGYKVFGRCVLTVRDGKIVYQD